MIIDKLIEKAKINKRTIVLVESDDIRILKASEQATLLDFANIILVGNEELIKKNASDNDINLDNIKIINPESSDITSKLIDKFYKIRKHKGITLDDAKDTILNNYLYYGCMLVYMDYADGMVAGATHKSSDVLRAALQTLKTSPDANIVSSFFLMDLENKSLGENGLFIFSDCGMIQNPTDMELVDIATEAVKSFNSLVGGIPKVAFLSHSTNLSSDSDDVRKVRSAVKSFKEKNPSIIADGEMQLDAAIIPSVSKAKFPTSKVEGNANILIFPDIDAGNISYKIAERIGNAKAYGPITQGIKKPVNDLSRGCDYSDIVGVIAITCNQVKN